MSLVSNLLTLLSLTLSLATSRGQAAAYTECRVHVSDSGHHSDRSSDPLSARTRERPGLASQSPGGSRGLSRSREREEYLSRLWGTWHPLQNLGPLTLESEKNITKGDKKSLHNYEYKYLPFLKRNEGRQGKSTKTVELQKVNPNELVIFSMVWREINKIMWVLCSKIDRDRVSKHVQTGWIHNKGRDFENVND